MCNVAWYPRRDDGTFAFVVHDVLTDNSLVFDVFVRDVTGTPHLALNAESESHAAEVANALNYAWEHGI